MAEIVALTGQVKELKKLVEDAAIKVDKYVSCFVTLHFVASS